MTLKITFGIFHLKIKLFYDGGDDRDGLFKMIYNTINNSFYIPKTNLALTSTLTYKRKLVISMVYKYKTYSLGKLQNRQELIEVF